MLMLLVIAGARCDAVSSMKFDVLLCVTRQLCGAVCVCVTGRLMHHLKEVEGMSLRTVEYCVFDEADRLFEMGFAAQLKEILAKMNESRQVHTVLSFSGAGGGGEGEPAGGSTGRANKEAQGWQPDSASPSILPISALAFAPTLACQ